MTVSLFPKTRAKLLAFFFLRPDSQVYFSELIRQSGLKKGSIQHELKNLTKLGIIHWDKRGNQTYYYINRAHPLHPDLHNLVVKAYGPANELRAALAPLRKEIEIAAIYGSIATGEETDRSDIDLLVIGKISFRKLTTWLDKIERRLGREINPSVYPLTEFKKKLKIKDHFVTSLLNSKMVFLIGTKNELTGLAEQ